MFVGSKYSSAEVRKVLDLRAKGYTGHAVARLTAIPQTTVANWLRGNTPGDPPRGRDGHCPRCGAPAHDFEQLPGPTYSYLLGIYLGDGHICRQTRGSYSLRVALDAAYPEIVAEVAAAIELIRKRGRLPWSLASRRSE
jgi:hypothetical protein